MPKVTAPMITATMTMEQYSDWNVTYSLPVTNGKVVTVNSVNRKLDGGSMATNGILFNLEDPTRMSGYVHTVTLRYGSGKLPTKMARIWIYGIVPINNKYIVCSQYLIPLSQISTIKTIQTYTIPHKKIIVSNESFIGVAIQDVSAAIATTSNGSVLHLDNTNLSMNVVTCLPLAFRSVKPPIGIQIQYILIT
ncbi:unnamed protein product [Rotaria sordida]|uniref:Uncharacterized protein n=1 Tax=Rotaria sordida TaxID=392033 RepID=A0A814XN95_9BILA|nr:unnamed protein product [Rotaria sordida]